MDVFTERTKRTLVERVSLNVRWTHIAIPLVAMFLACQMGKGQFGYLAADPKFMSAFHFDRNDIGVISGEYVLAFGFGILFWGQLVDRIGAKRMCLAGIVLWSLFLLIGGFAQDAAWIYISRIGFGFMTGAAWPVPNMFTARWFSQKERSTVNALWLLGVPMGIAVIGVTLPAIINFSGWRMTYFFIAGVNVLIALPLMGLLTSNVPATHSKVKSAELNLISAGLGLLAPKKGVQDPRRARKDVLTDYRFWLITAVFTVDCFQVWGLFSWGPSYLRSHFSLSTTGLILTTGYLLSLPVGIVLALWSDRVLLRAPFLAVGYGLVAASFFAIAWVSNAGNITAVLIVSAIVSVFAIATPATMSALHSIIPINQMGFATSFVTGVGSLIAASSPYVMGRLIGLQGNFSGAFLFIAIVASIGTVAGLLLIPSRV